MLNGSLECVDRATNLVGLGWNPILQRLFSIFPNHLPGFGLLLMRLSLGITLIHLGTANLPAAPAISIAWQLVGPVAGVFVIAGLWTPIAATVAALNQIWVALSIPSAQKDAEWIHVLLAILCASVAMLGPGAWSVDARLFGRRRFPTRQRGSHSPEE